MSYLKHFILLLVLSAAAVLFRSEVIFLLHQISVLHFEISVGLSTIFSNGSIGLLLKNAIALLAIPVIVAAIVGLIYFALRKKVLPHLIGTAWVLWFIVLVLVIR